MARFRNIFPNELHFKKLTLNPPMIARVAWGFLHSLSVLINFNTFLLQGNDRVFNSDAHENDSNCYQVSNLMMPQRPSKPIVLLADKKSYTNNGIGQPHNVKGSACNGLKIPKESNLAEKYNKIKEISH